MLSLLGLAFLGSLGLSISGASAQSIYVGTYAEPYPPYPIVEPYQVVVAPRYVARPVVVAPPPIARERTIVVSHPGYVSAPVLGPPLPPPYVVADW